MKRELLFVFVLVVFLSLTTPVLSVSETEFNSQFCGDFANNYADAREPSWVVTNTEKCLGLMQNYSLFKAINNKEFNYCDEIGYKLNWDDQLKFLYLSAPNFALACKIYFIRETKNYSVCDGADDTEKRAYFTSTDGLCISKVAKENIDLSTLDNYIGANEPSDGNGWNNAFVNFTSKEQCKTKWSYAESVCLNYLAQSGGNCEEIRDKSVQSFCFYNLAIKLNDFDICLKISDQRKGSCIIDFAVKSKNIDLCNSLGAGKDKTNCRNSVPLSFNKNQTHRIIIILIIPLLVIVLGIFIFSRYSAVVKIRYSIVSLIFLLYYLSWIFVVSGYRIHFNYIYLYIHGILLGIFFSVALVLMQIINLLLNVDIFLTYFAWSLLEFFVFLFYIVIFPEFFKIESKKLKYGLIIFFSVLTVVIILASIFFWVALSQVRI